jgi:hypothetical protein
VSGLGQSRRAGYGWGESGWSVSGSISIDQSRIDVEPSALDQAVMLTDLDDPPEELSVDGAPKSLPSLGMRHPEQLDTVVAHEPPSPELLPNPAQVRAAMEDVSTLAAPPDSGRRWRSS